MYSYIRGRITESGDGYVVVESCGIGYELSVSANTLCELSGREGEVKIYCYLSVREDGISLFGFSSEREKAMFLELLAVSGVGPKLAITVLSGMTTEQFAAAVVRADVKALSKIKGVGKKTAERIALELRDKVSKDYEAVSGEELMTPTATAASANDDATLALMTLGYSRQEAEAAVLRVQKVGMTLEELVYAALKNA